MQIVMINHFSNVVLLYCCWLVDVISVVSMTVVVSGDASCISLLQSYWEYDDSSTSVVNPNENYATSSPHQW